MIELPPEGITSDEFHAFEKDIRNEISMLFVSVQNNSRLQATVDTQNEEIRSLQNRLKIIERSVTNDDCSVFARLDAIEDMVNHNLSEIRRDSQNADTVLSQRIQKLEPTTSNQMAAKHPNMSLFEKNVLNDIHSLQVDQRINKKRNDVDAKRIVELAEAANELIHRVSELELNTKTFNTPSDVVHDIHSLSTEAEKRDDCIDGVVDRLNSLHRSIRNTIDALDSRVNDLERAPTTATWHQSFQALNEAHNNQRSRHEDLVDHVRENVVNIDVLNEKQRQHSCDIHNFTGAIAMHSEWVTNINNNLHRVEEKADNACLDISSIRDILITLDVAGIRDILATHMDRINEVGEIAADNDDSLFDRVSTLERKTRDDDVARLMRVLENKE